MNKICKRCVMDCSDPEIYFNDSGICNHCFRYDDILNSRVLDEFQGKIQLNKLIKKIKKSGEKKDYDCIIGVSGGVDSSYVAYLTKTLGLRPLAIHLDNGWNSELAVDNIKKILDKLDIDLYTYVLDWDIFSDLQKSFLYSSTPDGEVPTDHAINALLFKEANKRGIKYIISGMNFATESMSVRMWSYGHSDFKYIKDIYKKFGSKFSLKDYPSFNFFELFYWTFIRQIRVISILNYIDYQKEKAINILENELKWKRYEGKHYESVYTRFFQGYYLPKKFGIDKRVGHYSDLIRAGQISRSDALDLLKKSPYPSDSLLNQDIEFVLKKFNISEIEFEKIISKENLNFLSYVNNSKFVSFLKSFVNLLRKFKFYTK